MQGVSFFNVENQILCASAYCNVYFVVFVIVVILSIFSIVLNMVTKSGKVCLLISNKLEINLSCM